VLLHGGAQAHVFLDYAPDTRDTGFLRNSLDRMIPDVHRMFVCNTLGVMLVAKGEHQLALATDSTVLVRISVLDLVPPGLYQSPSPKNGVFLAFN
jgi:hypothetical protein